MEESALCKEVVPSVEVPLHYISYQKHLLREVLVDVSSLNGQVLWTVLAFFFLWRLLGCLTNRQVI